MGFEECKMHLIALKGYRSWYDANMEDHAELAALYAEEMVKLHLSIAADRATINYICQINKHSIINIPITLI